MARAARLVALVMLVIGIVAAACGGGGEDPTPTPAPSSTSEPTPRPTATPEPSPSPTRTPPPTQPPRTFEGGSFGPTEVGSPISAPVALQAVRVGNDIGFDTIVFEFGGEVAPGYRVEFVERAPACVGAVTPGGGAGSGSAGTPTQRIRGTPSPTAGPTLVPTATPTPTATPMPVTGAALLAVRFTPASASGVTRTALRGGEKALLEASQVCDTGTSVTWLLGLSGKQQFRVRTLESPPRIVLDIAQ